MAKDKMAHMADWEKKKDKLNRKRESARQVSRFTDKEDKKQKKELERIKEKQREVQLPAEVQNTIRMVQVVAAVVVVGLYVASMVAIQNGSMPAASESMPAVLTAVLVVLLTTVLGVGSCWRQALIRREMHREAANHIKGQLERKQTEQERAEKQKQRRAQQVKQLKEQHRRRVQQEAASLQQVKEIARMLRRRREEREAEEARAAAAVTRSINDQNEDIHGWSQSQYSELRIAVAKYPESWSHARKKRWEMISEEVNGQNARTCEAAFIRLEEERAAAAEAKAEGRKSAAQPEAQRNSLEDDLDWMGDETSTGDAGAAVDFDDPDDSEEDDDAEEDRVRMAVELEPEHKGTEIRLDNIKAMQGCACVQVEVLHLQVSCADCKASGQIFLSGADEDAAEAKTWCEGCSGIISVRLRPTLVHQSSTRLCYLDCVRCNIVDVLPSVLMTTCEECDAENVHKQEFVRNRVIHGTCTKCHSKYAFGADAIRIEQITPCDKGAASAPKSSLVSSHDTGDPMDEIAEELRWLRKKAKADPKQQMIQLGRPLPQMGACSHFKKSYKWYRFACCGRAFPCPECHAESGCPAAALGSHASRMICGKCSMEQAYSPARPCEKCGFAMQARGSAHWEDGGGTRNLAVMSTKDAKKFKGGLRQSNSKAKVSSSKNDRVGAKAKAKREYAQKFGAKS